MKKSKTPIPNKFSIIIITMFLFLLIVPSSFAETSTETIDYRGTITDTNGNPVCGQLIAYIDDIEHGINYPSSDYSNLYSIRITGTENDIGKPIAFKFKAYGLDSKIINVTSQEPILFQQSEYEPFVQADLITDNMPTITSVYTDKNNITTEVKEIFNIKLYVKFEDNTEEDITNSANWNSGLPGNIIKRINPGVYEALNTGSYNFYVSFCNKDIQILITVIDTLPIIQNTNIDNNPSNIPINSSITITFNKNIQQDINFNNIQIVKPDGTALVTNKTITNNILTITPLINFNYNTNYTFFIPSNAIKTLYGTPMNTEHTYNFTTDSESGTIIESTTVQGYITGVDNVNGIKVNLESNETYTDINGFYKFEDVRVGKYRLKAIAKYCKCNQKEVNVVDTNIINQNLELIPGDFNSDNMIDLFDLVILAKNYGR